MIHWDTIATIIVEYGGADKEYMGLTTYKAVKGDKIQKFYVVIVKNH